VNTVTHYIMPVVVVLDWLYQPPLIEARRQADIVLADLPAAVPGLLG